MDTIKNFLVEKPLYVKIKENLPEYSSELYPNLLLMDCSICKANRPFHFQQKGVRIPSPSSEKPRLKNGVYFLEYKCSGCLNKRFSFWIEVNTDQGWMRKVGQIPPWNKTLDKNLEKLLYAQQDYYKKGLICESQGYGIDAYAYYRRIVEDVVDNLLNYIEDIIEPVEKERYSNALKEVKKTIVAKEKIALVKDLLPSVLRPEGFNPLSILYSSLSDGIHNESDEKCLELAQHIREVLVFLTTQIAIHRESSKVFTESMRKILDRKNT